ncbi:hypothetical protein BY996DRAFT_6497787 [Phakopsora pachyrhizi]|nr:hypothetical protein BY996DRAFT_6497787 [Phakopsora pachyrhizi]
MTVLVDNKLEDPLIKNKKAVLNEDQFQWEVVTRGGDLWSEDYHGVSKWMAQTDRLGYDLRRWEPEDYKLPFINQFKTIILDPWLYQLTWELSV